MKYLQILQGQVNKQERVINEAVLKALEPMSSIQPLKLASSKHIQY